MLFSSHNETRFNLQSPTLMPKASAFLWNRRMMIPANCRGYALAQFMQPEPAKYSYAPNLFFFQAEDGIRAGHVTGVQTCALPISPHRRHHRRHPGRGGWAYVAGPVAEEARHAPDACRPRRGSPVPFAEPTRAADPRPDRRRTHQPADQ